LIIGIVAIWQIGSTADIVDCNATASGAMELYESDGIIFCSVIEMYTWIILYIGIALVALGSAYYHWAPTNATLVWDRLPMTIGFMALFGAQMAERLPGTDLLLPSLLAIGLFTVMYWESFDDLRPYLVVQFFPLLATPLLYTMFPVRYSHAVYLLYGILLYVACKITEVADKPIFAMTRQTVSGHTLKHLLAAGTVYVVFVMLQHRVLVPQHNSTQA
jgi:hypothetical protein